MSYLNTLDYTVILIYFCFLVALGFYLKKLASQSLDDYFLGGRRLPWWALGISGMASWLDITGTMMVVSFLYMLGPRGLYIEFRGGVALIMPFMLLWTGKWHRRSGCMTAAEWMIFRFGNGFGGQFARLSQAIASILLTVGMLAYLVKGVGLFLSMFLPFSPLLCSLIMIAIASVYTMASGFYGVVYTDIFQSVIIFIAVMTISIMAFLKVPDVQSLAVIARDVTGSEAWTTARLQWTTSMPKGYEAYHHLMMFSVFYFLRNVLGGAGGSGADPKYFGARNDRECGTLSFLWTWLLMFRWPMMIGFAVLGIYLVRDLFPDQTVLEQAAALIHQTFDGIEKTRWNDVVSLIANHPGRYPELAGQLQDVLGSDWATKLNFLSFEGTVNPERILPAVILYRIPMGFRGLILVALIAASMSTFDSTVNGTAALFVRDIYQRYLRPKAPNSELIKASWAFIAVLVAAGFLMGFTATSINDIWGWIIMGLGSGFLVPSTIRFFWWRFNGGGFASGMIAGTSSAIIQRILYPGLDERLQFIIILTISLIATITGTYLTPPTDMDVLRNFYRITRPFGFWKPLRGELPAGERTRMDREHRYDLIALPFVMGWHISLPMLPLLLITKAFPAFWITFAIFSACLTGMYFTWYTKLPPVDNR